MRAFAVMDLLPTLALSALTVALAWTLAVLAWVVRSQQRERQAWTQERAALLERLVPGLTLVDRPEPERAPQAYGTDEYEWEVERSRLKT